MQLFTQFSDQDEERPLSIVARHQSVNMLHHSILSIHGVWAVACWLAFTIQWLVPLKGKVFHQRLGRVVVFLFLFPLIITGLLLSPLLFMNISRANILLSSGHLVVPSMGFLFVITTQCAFFPTIFRRGFQIFNYVNIAFQLLGGAVLVSRIINRNDIGLSHENNVELLSLTLPFTLLQIYLTLPQLSGRMRLGHSFYTRYVTLQMFPGSMIVVARDHFWLLSSRKTMGFRLGLEIATMLPFYYLVFSYLYRARKYSKRMGIVGDGERLQPAENLSKLDLMSIASRVQSRILSKVDHVIRRLPIGTKSMPKTRSL